MNEYGSWVHHKFIRCFSWVESDIEQLAHFPCGSTIRGAATPPIHCNSKRHLGIAKPAIAICLLAP